MIRAVKAFAAGLSRQVALLLLGWLAVGALHAQLPTTRLSNVFPMGGKPGSTVDVSIGGTDLDDVTQLLFSTPGITAATKTDANGKPEANRFQVTISQDTPPGLAEVRAVGRFGISNPRAFVVGDLNELSLATTTNTSSAAAVEIPLGTTANCRMEAQQNAWFRFEAKQGQRVLAWVDSFEIDSRLQEVVSLHDANGRELQRNRRNGLIDFTAPADGRYLVQVHDFTYRGGAGEYFYRLTVTTGPWIDFIYPPVGLAGSKAKYLLIGRNLPGGTPMAGLQRDGHPLEKLELEIQAPAHPTAQLSPQSGVVRPNAAGLDSFDYRLPSAKGFSNPLRMGFAFGPVTVEPIESDGSAPQKLTQPCEFVGRFRARGEYSTLLFDAKKGEVLWLEVVSQRLNQPTDPFMVVQRVVKNDKGEESYPQIAELYDSDANLGGAEFNTTTRDPNYRFAAPEDGTYRIQVRDLFNRNEGDSRYLYRLTLRRESPDFELVALPMQPPKPNNDARVLYPWAPNLRKLETQVIKVLAIRRDGFSGEIQLHVDGMPGGVSTVDEMIESGKNSALIPLTARENVNGWGGNLKITGKAKIGDTEVVREAIGGTVVWQVGDFNAEPVTTRLTRNVAMGICGAEKAAMSIEPVEDRIYEAPANGKLTIPIRVNRHSEFMEALKLKAVGLSALDPLGELEVTTKTNVATLEIDLAKFKLPPGPHNFLLQTQAKGKYRSYATEAQTADGDAARAEKEANSAVTEAKKAAEALAAAAKALTEAETQAKSVSDKDKEALQNKVKEAAEAKVKAEKTSTEAAAKSEAAAKKNTEAQARKKDLNAKAAGREATVLVYSSPIQILVKPEEKKLEEKKAEEKK